MQEGTRQRWKENYRGPKESGYSFTPYNNIRRISFGFDVLPHQASYTTPEVREFLGRSHSVMRGGYYASEEVRGAVSYFPRGKSHTIQQVPSRYSLSRIFCSIAVSNLFADLRLEGARRTNLSQTHHLGFQGDAVCVLSVSSA